MEAEIIDNDWNDLIACVKNTNGQSTEKKLEAAASIIEFQDGIMGQYLITLKDQSDLIDRAIETIEEQGRQIEIMTAYLSLITTKKN